MTEKLILKGREFKNKKAIDWYNSRPKLIQELISHAPLDCVCELEEANQLVIIYSYCENGTFKVIPLRELNPHLFEIDGTERCVFGIVKEDLEFYCFDDEKDKIAEWKLKRIPLKVKIC